MFPIKLFKKERIQGNKTLVAKILQPFTSPTWYWDKHNILLFWLAIPILQYGLLANSLSGDNIKHKIIYRFHNQQIAFSRIRVVPICLVETVELNMDSFVYSNGLGLWWIIITIMMPFTGEKKYFGVYVIRFICK